MVWTRHLFPFVFPKAIFFQFWMALGLIAYIFLVLHDRQYLPQKSVLLWLLGVWGAALLLAGIFGFNPINSLWSKAERMDGLWFYANLFAFGFMLLGILKTKQDWLLMLKLNTGIGVLIGLVALVSKYSSALSGLGDQTRLSGTFGNPAFLATYFVIFVFLCLILAAAAQTRQGKVFWFVCVLFGLTLVLMSGTRGAYIGAAAGIGVWVLGLFLFGSRRLRIVGAVLICLAIGLGISLVAARPLWEKTLPMVASRVYSITAIPTQRILVWQVGWQAFKARPVFGWGQENFINAFNQYFDPEIFKYEVAIFDRPHNKAVDVLVTTGLAGGLSYLAVFGTVAWFLLKKLYQGRLNRLGEDFELGTTIGLAALWLAYLVQNLVLFEMPTSAIQLFFCLAFSVWFLGGSQKNKQRNDSDLSRPLIKNLGRRYLVFGAAVILIGWSIVKGAIIPWQASKEFVGAMVNLSQSMNQEYYQASKALYLSARSKNTFLNKEFDVNFSRHLRAISALNSTEWSKNLVDLGHQVMGYLEQDLNRYRQDYDILVELSNLMLDFQVKYRDQQAGGIPSVLARAVEYAPKRLESYEALFTYYSAVDDEAQAKQVLAKLFSLAPEVGDTWYYQAVYNAQWGNHNSVINDLRQSIEYGFAAHDRPREQEWLLNLYISRGRFSEALEFLEFLRSEPRASSLRQLRYALLAIEIVYISGDVSRAAALQQDLLARLPEQNKPAVLEYLQGRGIVLEP
jgi:O-antigen ligase/tetratricopeptide (TPR) repeat protein